MYKTIKSLNLLTYNIYNFVIHFLRQFLWFWKKYFSIIGIFKIATYNLE